jgi:hypothetical protein
VLKRTKPQRKSVQIWDHDSEEELIGCLEVTSWDALYDRNESIDRNVDVLTSYINFCVNNIIKTKDVTLYPNTKTWMCKELRTLFHEKDNCLRNINDRTQLKTIQKDINKRIHKCKQDYKTKVEELFHTNCSRDAWKALKKLTGLTKKNVEPSVTNVKAYCDELNVFYSRFDIYDFSRECQELVNVLKCKHDDRIIVSEEEVVMYFSKIKVHKANGPDSLAGRILKLCKDQLAPIFATLFQRSSDECYVPINWKLSEIIPIAKKPRPQCNNDYRPVALSSVAMKCLEKIVKSRLSIEVKVQEDPLQFAYTKQRCVLDPTISIVHDVLKFLDTPSKKNDSRYAKILFIDFSSAFNTIQPHVLIDRLMNMNVNSNIILWIFSFLNQRNQYVKFKGVYSDIATTCTGAPQGCVLSPLLFTLYTSNCRSESLSCKLYKYADDTALIGLCSNTDTEYAHEVERFVNWCSSNFLNLNVQKTKEMIVDFRRGANIHECLVINNEEVERVSNYKYLGTVIDNRLVFTENVNLIYKKANSRLYHLRKLHSLHTDTKIIELFYRSMLESVISFGIAVWYGNCSVASRKKLFRVIKSSIRLGVLNSKSLEELYNFYVMQRADIIISDVNHPLHDMYHLLRSGSRFRTELTRTVRYNKSFVPSSIRLLNNKS